MEAPSKPRSVVRALLCIFWGCLLVYHVNGRPHAGHDTVAAPYTAWAVVRHGSLDLHHYADLKRFVGTAVYALPDGRWINFRSPGTALAVVPFVAPLAAFREEPFGMAAMHHLGKLAAAVHLAAAAVLFFLLCRRFVPRAAWPATILFAFGTCLWSDASQAIWQHGPATFWLTLALYLLTDFTKTMGVKRGLLVGLVLGLALLTRPPTLFFLLATGFVFLCQRRWRGLLGLTLGSSVLMALYCAFNYYYFGDLLRGGYTAGDNWDVSNPLWLGLGGLLIAPSRGLFVYSPALLLLPWGIWRLWTVDVRWEQRASGPTCPPLPCTQGRGVGGEGCIGLEKSPPLTPDPSPLSTGERGATFGPLASSQRFIILGWIGASVATLMLFAKWHDWPGGWCYGPRFLCETMPVCCLLFAYAYSSLSARWLRGVAVGLVAVSVYIHAVGIFGHGAETDWCWRHTKSDQGRCFFGLRDTQIEAYSGEAFQMLGRRLSPNRN